MNQWVVNGIYNFVVLQRIILKEKKTMREKMKSWALWLALGALIVFLVKEFTGMDISDSMDNFLNVLLPVLVGFGVINNPNSREKI